MSYYNICYNPIADVVSIRVIVSITAESQHGHARIFIPEGANFPFPMTLSCCHMLATGLLLHLLRWARPRLGEVMVTMTDEMLWGWFNHHIYLGLFKVIFFIFPMGNPP